jgi:hypothetical protein
MHFKLSASEIILLSSEFRSPFAVFWDFKACLICITKTFVFIIHFAMITLKTEGWSKCIKSRPKVRVILNVIFVVLNEWILFEVSQRK